jgi:hypothetical protein
MSIASRATQPSFAGQTAISSGQPAVPPRPSGRATRGTQRTLTLGASLLAGALIAACGGGGSSGSVVSTSESQIAGTGTVTGFGSVIIDGVKYDDSLTSVRVLDDDSSPRDASLNAIRLGMRVDMRTDNLGRLSGLGISPELKGPIGSINTGAKTMVVLGQTVQIATEGSNTTVFEGVSGLAALEAGMIVEVHGTRDAAGQIVATRIERKSLDDAANLRLTGTINALDTNAKRFSVGSLVVDYASVPVLKLLPNAAALENGKRVAVWSSSEVIAGVLSAQAVSVRGAAAGATTDRIRLSGLSSTPDTSARSFLVNGIRVSYASASFKDGSSSDLGSTKPVRIRGTLGSDGTVNASEIKFVTKLYSNDDNPVIESEVTGVITDFVSRASFKVRGVPIDASSDAINFESGSAANLADGVLVKIEGSPSASGLLPSKVRFVTTEDSRTRWLAGSISGRATVSGTVTFQLMGLDVRLANDATVTRFDGTSASPTDLINGQAIRVSGAIASGVFVARSVILLPDNLTQLPREVEGVASEVSVNISGVGSFKVGSLTVTTSGSTVFEGAVSSLKNGVRVEALGPVSGTAPALTLAATKVEVKLPESGPRVRISGMVSEFTSQSSTFRIGTQRVNAASAPTLSGLANGRFVKAKGVMQDGVLIVNNDSEHELELK